MANGSSGRVAQAKLLAASLWPVSLGRNPYESQMNLCRSCGLDFIGERDFDSHRTGKSAYDFSLKNLDGRRCLAESELIDKGWLKDKNGRMGHPRRKA